ncbi:FAD-dependent oxidoreductase [Candidatus Saccharibacteria bacterium]|nr:FAD-dependent oxidoreductase [Candidatus Saccharibacteria bacterium]
MKVTFDHIETVSHDVKTLWFKPEKPIRQIAGQFTEISLPHKNADDRGERRWFTLSNSPKDKGLSITTRFLGDEASSFKKNLQKLKPLSTLNLADPMGDFVLPKDPKIPLLFVAGGIGCTPFHSIIKYLKDTGEKRDIHMIYAANRLEDVIFKNLFSTLEQFEIILTNPPDNWNGESGHIKADYIFDRSDKGERHIYLSGPEPMVEILDKDLINLGIDRKRLHTDYFPGYQPI